MHRTPIAAALLATVLLVACSDSDSGNPSSSGDPIITDPTGNGMPSFDGTWVHTDNDGFRQTYVFQGDQAHYISTLHECIVSETWGAFSVSSTLLRITPDSTYIRRYSDNSVDSASTCASERSKAQVSGTMPFQLESVTASSFTVIKHSITIVNNQTSLTTESVLFRKQ